MDDAHPKMRFSLLSPTPTTTTTTTTTTKQANKTDKTQTTSTKSCASTNTLVTSPRITARSTTTSTINNNNNNSNCNYKNARASSKNNRININHNNNNNYFITNMLGRNRGSSSSGGGNGSAAGATGGIGVGAGVDEAAALSDGDEAASDYNQWLHAMKLVARLPGGTPPEFRRKLWLSLADKYLKSKHVDWAKQQEKCFSEEWREDDEELGIQIVKDLHRTGSNLCTGPAGSINQAKLKRILLGYARYNPEVGYCQGFNMLGALILQVMDKEEVESMKVMIYLVEGILPAGYFCGSMGGLQADMGVFRELMQTKLPRLAKHLQKLQGPIENAYEPPLTNVFTMQWFLTMFCTCLPMSCVLRVWDLVLIEGSDVLLRTAIVLWSLLEERVLSARSADEFYGKMGSFSSELLNGHLTDSNGLIERVVQLGPIPDLQKLRNKHLYNIAPLRNKQGLQLYYDDEELHSDEESRLAVATVWGLPWGRRGSASAGKHTTENKDRLALDISLLKKQYDRLRERQRQAHVILTTACTTAARQGSGATTVTTAPSGGQHSNVPVNQLLMGRPAIVMNKGKRVGPPVGAIPPARKPSLPAVLHTKQPERQLRRGETLHWRDTDLSKRRRDSLTWKEIKADRAALLRDGVDSSIMKSQKLRSRMGKSDSSSYSEDSDGDLDAGDDGSSTDTSLCDDDDPSSTGDKPTESSPKRKSKSGKKLKEVPKLKPTKSRDSSMERQRPKSWAPTTHEIPFMLMTSDSPVHSGDEKKYEEDQQYESLPSDTTKNASLDYHLMKDLNWPEPNYSEIAGDLASSALVPLHVDTDILELPVVITSTSQLSPMPDIATYLNSSTISPLPTPKPLFVDSVNSLGSTDGDGEAKKAYDVSDDGVTNQYFERVNSVERPTKLELFYSLSEDESVRNAYEYRVDGEGESEPNDSESNGSKAQNNLRNDEEFFEKGNPEVCSDNNKKNICELDKNEMPPEIIDSESIPTCRVPVEKKNDFKEVLSMTIAEKSKPNLSSASRKRRDPRRLTLARSSTIDLEERFQALERRLSEDIMTKAPAAQETTKRIPSTADLEARYSTLEKTLSSEKEKDLETKTKTSINEFDEDLSSKPRAHERIPSTANLEDRFNALAKQMSSSSADGKEPVDLKDESNRESKRNDENEGNEKTSQKRHLEDAKSDSKSSSEKTETQSGRKEENKDRNEKEDKPRLKKLPSTAELEDRFNALERKMSIQKSSPAKTKKEPPDEVDDRKSNVENKTKNEELKKETDNKKESATETKEPKEDVTNRKVEKNSLQNKEAENEDDEHHLQKSTRAVKSKEQERSAEKESESKVETDQPKRKTPPSIEELEKRFEALERQLSTTNLNDGGAQNKKTHKTTDDEQKESSKLKETPKTTTKTDAQSEKLNESIEKRKSTKNEQTESKERTQSENNAEKECVGNNQCKSEIQTKKSIKSFEEKCQSVNEKITSETRKPTSIEQDEVQSSKEAIYHKDEKLVSSQDNEDKPKDLSKRRASEPPSTEDLEKRYETLKRRMSTRNQFSSKSETVDEALQRIEQEVIAEIGEVAEEAEKMVEKLLPTTEDLESRYEALHRNDKKVEKVNQKSKTPIKTPANTPVETPVQTPKKEKSPTERRVSTTKRVDVAIEAHIPEAPPMPEVLFNKSNVADAHPAGHQQRALIEELQSKIKGEPGEENLKPSEINPTQRRRIPQRPATMGDETSEAPANTAYYRSENYEPWQQSKIMVRRFSDLPSRADLENRLQFLEKQLYRKFYKQRCASDSDVASKGLTTNSVYDERPSTSHQSNDLEKRVLALEKQLSENSLKLLEAMRAKAAAVSSGSESDSPRRFSTETIDAAGKELVRYEHFGEMDETDNCKPINISINIKMLMNKEREEQKRKESSNLPTTEELRQRLETLEQELSAERAKNACSMETKNDVIRTDETNCEEAVGSPVQNEAINNDKNSEVVEEEDIQPKPMEIRNEDNSEAKEKVELKDDLNEISEPKTTQPSEKKENKEIIEKVITPVKEVPPTKCETILKESLVKQEETEEISKDVSQNNETTSQSAQNLPKNMIINATELGAVDPNNKTLVLLMDNEPKAVKVRRLTRANTEELEGLFQALEKQLSERNLVKSEDGKLVHADSKPSEQQPSEESKAITDLSKEIQEFASGDTKNKVEPTKAEAKEEEAKPNVSEDYDWGPNPVKHHLKRRTVHLPSTKELESRFRSLERQIKLLEDVEKIDVEQRLNEIERKIKLQYSLSHEKDLNKYLELCEGKGLDDEPLEPEVITPIKETANDRARSPRRREQASKSPYTSPSRARQDKSQHTSPSRTRAERNSQRSPYTSPPRSRADRESQRSPYTSPSRTRAEKDSQRSPYTSPARTTATKQKQSPYTSPARRGQDSDAIPVSDDLEYRYRVLDLVRSKSKERLAKKKIDPNKPPIHPLEMLLDPSPDENDIPTTGELEHRLHVLDEKVKSPTRKARSYSPTIDDMKRKKRLADKTPKTPVHDLEKLVASPTKPEPPTEDELEARMRALEDEKKFDFKTQKDYKEFNRKLKDVISPSLSFEEFKAAKSREQSPRRGERSTTPKSSFRDSDTESRRDETTYYRPISPKVIRFRDEDEEYYEEDRAKSRTERERSTERMVGKENGVLDLIAENTKILERILQKTLADSSNSIYSGGATATIASTEGLDSLGTRLMRETSPLRRTGTHTGVPLRTGENINDRLSSIKETIKSIDSLCTEKPYQKEKCQRYIDSLFSDSLHFSSKKTSLEDLHCHSRSESRGRMSQSEYTPAIRITSEKGSAGQRSSEYRTLGSTESIRTTSPSRAASPPHHRSNRDLLRDISPRRRRDEEREEYESSRVRRDKLLPNYSHDNSSDISSYSSLTKFHKVDRQLNTYKYDERERSSSRSASRSPLRSPYESRELVTGNTTRTYPGYNQQHLTTNNINSSNRPRFEIDRPVSPYRQPSHNNLPSYEAHKRSNTPAYTPAKLEIRHTTVTSTFYDRLLTEKQIEKSLTRPPSRSPVISPSITSKSYNDLPHASLGASRAKDDYSSTLTGVTSPGRSLTTKIGAFGMASSYTGTSLPTTSNSYLTATSSHNVTTSNTNYLSATSTNGELRIRSCENILSQLKAKTESSGTGVTTSAPRFGLALPGLTSTAPIVTTRATVQPTSTAINITTTSLNSTSFTFTDTYKSYLSTTTTTTSTNASNVACTAATITTTNSYATGVYNPLMSLTLRQPISTSSILAQYSSTLPATEKSLNEQSKI